MITKKVEKLVKEACKSNDCFGYSVWAHHISLVVKYSSMMAEYFGADKEIVEISALLHDYAIMRDIRFWKEHHKHGAQMAEGILTELGYPTDKIDRVKHCILSHRGSRDIERETAEAQCVADGDAMSHFDAIAVMFYVSLVLNKMDIVESNKWVLGKLTRSWNKMSLEAKEIVREKYEAAKLLLEAFKA